MVLEGSILKWVSIASLVVVSLVSLTLNFKVFTSRRFTTCINESIVRAFAKKDTDLLNLLKWEAVVRLNDTSAVQIAEKCLSFLSPNEEWESVAPVRSCKYKTYTGENLDELLPQLMKYYDIVQLQEERFWKAAASVPKRINSRYTTDGKALISSWRKYHLVDITDCDELTPECLIWKHPAINTSEHNTDKTYRKCCVEHARLLSTLRDVLAKMSSAGIVPWLGMGTLLAAKRHRGVFVGWDTDVDLYILPKDVETFKTAFKNGRNTTHWFAVDPQSEYNSRRDMYYIYHTRKRTKGGPHVEVWIWNNKKQDVSKYVDLVFPLTPCKLYDLKNVWCPRDSEKMLDLWYSGTWKRYRFTMGRDTVMLT